MKKIFYQLKKKKELVNVDNKRRQENVDFCRFRDM